MPDRRYWSATGGLLAIAGVLAFVGLAGEMQEGETLGFDRALLLALRDPADLAIAIGPGWLPAVARDITGLGGTAVLSFVTFVVCCYLALSGRIASALMTLAAVGSGTLLSTLLKMVYDRPRPDLVPHAVEVTSASFPSGHAMLSAVTYLTLGALLMPVQNRRSLKIYVLAVASAITLMVGLSRVYLGVHWPTDVIGGWCVGAAWALLCWLLAERLRLR